MIKIPDIKVYGMPEKLLKACRNGSTVWRYDDGIYLWDGLKLSWLREF